jgi:hypothetical protein
VHLIDTPGFDDTNLSDTEVLWTITLWLNISYRANIHLSGIIYLHPINKNRMTGTAHRNLRMFQQLCGLSSLSAVVLATTMWKHVSEQEGRDREAQLTADPRFWGEMIAHGSFVMRHHDNEESALTIVEHLLRQGRTTVLDIQRQMTDEGRRLEDTSAAQELRKDIAREKEEIERRLKRATKERDAALAADDEERRKRADEQTRVLQGKIEACERRERETMASMQDMLEREKQTCAKVMTELEEARRKLLNSSSGPGSSVVSDLESSIRLKLLEDRLRTEQQRMVGYNSLGAYVGASAVIGATQTVGIVVTAALAATLCTVM